MTFDPAAAATVLESADVALAPGLTAVELSTIEARFNFRFSPDHRALLAHCQPAGERWVNWRTDPPATIERALRWPVEGLLLHVDAEDFWFGDWGLRPCEPDLAHEVAASQLARAPKLIPLFAHRYLPAAPTPAGAPVLSVYQSDVIYYGADLTSYLRNEFLGEPGPQSLDEIKYRVPFWSELAED